MESVLILIMSKMQNLLSYLSTFKWICWLHLTTQYDLWLMACQLYSRIWRFQTSFTFLCTFECVCFLWGHLCWPSSISVVAGHWPVFQKSRNFSGIFWLPQFALYLLISETLSHETLSPLGFSDVKNTFKVQLFKTSKLQFENLLLGPKKSMELWRNRPQIWCLQCLSETMIFSWLIQCWPFQSATCKFDCL